MLGVGIGLSLSLTAPSGAGGPAPLAAAPFASVNGPTTGPYLAGMTSGVFEGMSVEFAATNPTIPNPDGGSPMTFQTDRPAFDSTGAATTYRDTLYVAKQMRKSAPNQASMTSHTALLSDWLYANDVLTGATNNSTLTSPKAVGNWAMPDRGPIGNALSWEIVAGHRNARAQKQIACAIPRVTGKISGVTQTVTYAAVSTITISASCPMDYGKVLVLGSTLDVSNFDDNQELVLNAKCYPLIGGASSVYDSGDGTFTDRKDFSPRYFGRNTAVAATPPRAYVSTTGVNATGVISTNDTLARANPFLTTKGVTTALKTFGACDGVQIRHQAGTWVIDGPASGTLTQAIGWLVFTRDPLVAKNLVTLTFGSSAMDYLSINTGLANTPNTSAVLVDDVQVVRTAAFKFYIGTTIRNELFWRNVIFDNGGFSGTYLDLGDDYFFGITITGASGNFLGAATAGQHRMHRGVTMTASGTMEVNTVLGCNITNPGSFVPSNGKTCEGQVICFSRFDGVSTALFTAQDNVTYGVLWDQNEVAFTSATPDTICSVSNDAKTNSTRNMLCRNNTSWGASTCGRVNRNYEDGPTERTNILGHWSRNIWPGIYVKSDLFRYLIEGNPEGFTTGSPSTRVGDWGDVNGVGDSYELTGWITTSNTAQQEYSGIGNKVSVTANVLPSPDPLFTTNHCTTCVTDNTHFTAGSLGSDLTLQAGSPCKGAVPDSIYPYDLLGNARPATNDSIGAHV